MWNINCFLFPSYLQSSLDSELSCFLGTLNLIETLLNELCAEGAPSTARGQSKQLCCCSVWIGFLTLAFRYFIWLSLSLTPGSFWQILAVWLGMWWRWWSQEGIRQRVEGTQGRRLRFSRAKSNWSFHLSNSRLDAENSLLEGCWKIACVSKSHRGCWKLDSYSPGLPFTRGLLDIVTPLRIIAEKYYKWIGWYSSKSYEKFESVPLLSRSHSLWGSDLSEGQLWRDIEWSCSA